MVFIDKMLYPLHHVGRGRHLLDGFLGIKPAAGVVVTHGDDLRHGDRLIGQRRFFFHSPDHPETRLRRGHIQVITFGVAPVQLDPEARMQPALFVGVLEQQARLCAKTLLVRHHIGQRPAPGLPDVVNAFAAHDHGDIHAGAAKGVIGLGGLHQEIGHGGSVRRT